jgi:biopolymer transport protein ExbD
MGRKKNRSARLEMTSLMDVMFLVLVFFIYCIFDMAVHKGLKVDLPNAPGADEKGERIVITIGEDDSIQFNGVPSSKEDAVARVRELAAVDMKLPVLISGDRRATLGVGIELLGELKAVGVEKASFQVSGERGGEAGGR